MKSWRTVTAHWSVAILKISPLLLPFSPEENRHPLEITASRLLFVLKRKCTTFLPLLPPYSLFSCNIQQCVALFFWCRRAAANPGSPPWSGKRNLKGHWMTEIRYSFISPTTGTFPKSNPKPNEGGKCKIFQLQILFGWVFLIILVLCGANITILSRHIKDIDILNLTPTLTRVC